MTYEQASLAFTNKTQIKGSILLAEVSREYFLRGTENLCVQFSKHGDKIRYYAKYLLIFFRICSMTTSFCVEAKGQGRPARIAQCPELKNFFVDSRSQTRLYRVQYLPLRIFGKPVIKA